MAAQVSLKLVAEKAGVSTATVSRVVNGHRAIAAATRQRVQKVIDQLGYSPDPKLGQFFKTMNGGVKGVAFALHPELHERLAAFSDPFYARMSLAVQAELSCRGHHMILANSNTDSTPDGNLNCVAQGLCNGVIAKLRDRNVIMQLAKHVPLVLLNADYDMPCVDVVIPNVERAAQRQLAHLFDLGHRAVACFRPDSTETGPSWQDRRFLNSYRNFCTSHNMVPPAQYLAPIECEPGEDAAAITDYLDRILSRPDIAPTAIMTYDGYAGELIRQLSSRGYRVPRDISIVGYDDCTFNHPCPIGLTTFRQDFEAMAKEAVRLLLERIKDPARPAMLVELEGEFIARESSAAPPAVKSSKSRRGEKAAVL